MLPSPMDGALVSISKSPRRSQLSRCLRPPMPEKSRPEIPALASHQCVARPRTCFPEVRRCRMDEREQEQRESAKLMTQRLCLEPSPRILGVDVNALDFSFDRGTMSTVEAPYEQNSTSARTGWKAIHSLPQDHRAWQNRQAKWDDTCRQEDRLWALEERYNDHMVRLASDEAVKLRQERRRNKGSEDPVSKDFSDYWLSASEVAAMNHAKGDDYARSSCGRWKVPPERPMTQGRSVAVCGGLSFRGDSGLQARARRRTDQELLEVNTASPAHPCGPGPCFPLHSEPPRLDALP